MGDFMEYGYFCVGKSRDDTLKTTLHKLTSSRKRTVVVRDGCAILSMKTTRSNAVFKTEFQELCDLCRREKMDWVVLETTGDDSKIWRMKIPARKLQTVVNEMNIERWGFSLSEGLEPQNPGEQNLLKGYRWELLEQGEV